MSASKIKTGLAGFGVVGKHVYQQISADHSTQFEIVKVAIKHPEIHTEIGIPFTTNLFELAYDPEINVIIELIGGIQPAHDFIRESLRQKKHVITANKFLIAYHGEELRKLADENGVQLLYEASVGGSIPILSTLNGNLRHHQIHSVTGIINGSTNFILTQLHESPKTPVETILKEARDLGFLEADPSYDLKGWDIQQKLAVMAWHAFGVNVLPAQIPAFSLMELADEDKFLTGYGKLKYLANIEKQNDHLSAWVLPELVTEDHPFYDISNEYNAIRLNTRYSGNQVLVGKGAGGNPTACSVIADLLAVEHQLPEVKENNQIVVNHNRILDQVYLRAKKGQLKKLIQTLGTLGLISRLVGADRIVVKQVPLVSLTELQPLTDLAVNLPKSVFIEKIQTPMQLYHAVM